MDVNQTHYHKHHRRVSIIKTSQSQSYGSSGGLPSNQWTVGEQEEIHYVGMKVEDPNALFQAWKSANTEHASLLAIVNETVYNALQDLGV